MVLAFQRSGTHWISSELYQHPCIDVQPEIFLVPPDEKFQWDTRKRRAAMEAWFAPRAKALEEFTSNFKSFAGSSRDQFLEGRVVSGFNIKINQGFEADWDAWYKDFAIKHSIKIIWIQRRNQLRMLVSGLLNQKTGVAATTDEKVLTNLTKHIRVDPGYILDRLESGALSAGGAGSGRAGAVDLL
jgi:hypothetical protein